MRKITVNAIVDIGCLVTFIPSLISGLVLYLVLPSGGGRGNSWSVFLNIPRSQWLNMHNYTSLIFAALIIIHLVLHWMYFRNIRRCFIAKDKAAFDVPVH
jgi:hypothetical protein